MNRESKLKAGTPIGLNLKRGTPEKFKEIEKIAGGGGGGTSSRIQKMILDKVSERLNINETGR